MSDGSASPTKHGRILSPAPVRIAPSWSVCARRARAARDRRAVSRATPSAGSTFCGCRTRSRPFFRKTSARGASPNGSACEPPAKWKCGVSRGIATCGRSRRAARLSSSRHPRNRRRRYRRARWRGMGAENAQRCIRHCASTPGQRTLRAASCVGFESSPELMDQLIRAARERRRPRAWRSF